MASRLDRQGSAQKAARNGALSMWVFRRLPRFFSGLGSQITGRKTESIALVNASASSEV